MSTTPLREIKHVIFHQYPYHTLDELKRNHRKQGLVRCGYHYAITPDGVIHLLRPEDWGGWFDKRFDDNSIGVAMVGAHTMSRAGAQETLVDLLQGSHGRDIELIFVDKDRTLR